MELKKISIFEIAPLTVNKSFRPGTFCWVYSWLLLRYCMTPSNYLYNTFLIIAKV